MGNQGMEATNNSNVKDKGGGAYIIYHLWRWGHVRTAGVGGGGGDDPWLFLVWATLYMDNSLSFSVIPYVMHSAWILDPEVAHANR